MKMTNIDFQNQFYNTCQKIENLEKNYDESTESAYEELLDLIKNNISHYDWIKEKIKETIREFKNSRNGRKIILSIDAIAFCMFELRWEEILDCAKIEHKEYFSKKMETTLIILINAFNDNWEQKIDYKRYEKNG